MPFEQQLVDFVGGPFDGHCLMLDASRRELIPLATFAVSANVLRMLIGKLPGGIAPITSTAVYELERNGPLARYRFLRSEPAAKAEVGGPKRES
ncbi:MAG TPA: hypothetical protein VHC19_30010 [Pirellulales bacterium]|jgi:hypothetical protein|nr:hypothetical protein [Pirellulales bacterium]